MELISTGTDFDVLRYVTTFSIIVLFRMFIYVLLPLEKRSLQDIFIKQLGLKVSVNSSTSGLGFLHTCTQLVLFMAWDVSSYNGTHIWSIVNRIMIDTPSHIVYHELILTSKEYMTQVTAIDPYWLGESLIVIWPCISFKFFFFTS
jgi:hypothetical protein